MAELYSSQSDFFISGGLQHQARRIREEVLDPLVLYQEISRTK
jgi:hypothetical protein